MSWAGPLRGRDREGGKTSVWRAGSKRGRALLGSSTERRTSEPHPPLRLEKWFVLPGWELRGAGEGRAEQNSRLRRPLWEGTVGRGHWLPPRRGRPRTP